MSVALAVEQSHVTLGADAVPGESNLKRKVLRMIKQEFPQFWFYKPNDHFTSGIPDVVGCGVGRFFAVELKFGAAKPTALQAHVIDNIRKAGGTVCVARTVQEVRNFLFNILTDQQTMAALLPPKSERG